MQFPQLGKLSKIHEKRGMGRHAADLNYHASMATSVATLLVISALRQAFDVSSCYPTGELPGFNLQPIAAIDQDGNRFTIGAAES